MDIIRKHPHTSVNIFTRNPNLSQKYVISPLSVCVFRVLSVLLLQYKYTQFKGIGDGKYTDTERFSLV